MITLRMYPTEGTTASPCRRTLRPHAISVVSNAPIRLDHQYQPRNRRIARKIGMLIGKSVKYTGRYKCERKPKTLIESQKPRSQITRPRL
jgi:hypothetical protein